MKVKNTFFSKIRWFHKRLSVITIRELLFRIKEQLDIFSMYFKYIFWKPNKRLVNYNFLTSSKKILPDFKWKNISDSSKMQLLNGKVPLFGSDWFWGGQNTTKNWHSAPESCNVWPNEFFNNIQFRQGNEVGDIRIAWEASRLQHLIALALIAQNAKINKERTIAVDLYCQDISSWYQQNPLYSGIHYVSSMECALRIISLSISFDLMRTNLGSKVDEVSSLVGILITNHAEFITKRMSMHSSAGNHVLAESMGLIFAGLLFSEHPSSRSWLSKGLKIFELEVDRQINHTGYGLEGASNYLIQIIEYAFLCEALLKAYKRDIPQKISKALERGLKEVRSIYEKMGFMPIIGDSDSSFAVSFLFNEIFNKQERSSGYEANTHLLAIADVSQPLSLIFCNGPLGMAPTYGHGHAHALSIQLFFNDEPVLSDPGTYSYTGHPSWREYFRSTKAHNTINVNDKDQAQQELLFLWSKPYQCRNIAFEKFEDCYICISEHNGYIDEGVLHRRLIIFSTNKGLYVKDFLISSCAYKAELCWNVNFLLDRHKIYNSSDCLLEFEIKSSTSDNTLTNNYGIEDGWYSSSYNKKQSISRIVSDVTSEESSSFESVFFLPSAKSGWYHDAKKHAHKLISEISIGNSK